MTLNTTDFISFAVTFSKSLLLLEGLFFVVFGGGVQCYFQGLIIGY